mmetsp:Transcript_30739/g.73701  ORF Transcript_30739/g.73701 Transcript_30739/m.73701 type:complete len:219 (-) Transcript_30739:261-917(-)
MVTDARNRLVALQHAGVGAEARVPAHAVFPAVGVVHARGLENTRGHHVVGVHAQAPPVAVRLPAGVVLRAVQVRDAPLQHQLLPPGEADLPAVGVGDQALVLVAGVRGVGVGQGHAPFGVQARSRWVNRSRGRRRATVQRGHLHELHPVPSDDLELSASRARANTRGGQGVTHPPSGGGVARPLQTVDKLLAAWLAPGAVGLAQGRGHAAACLPGGQE